MNAVNGFETVRGSRCRTWELFRHKVLAFLKAEGLISDERVEPVLLTNLRREDREKSCTAGIFSY